MWDLGSLPLWHPNVSPPPPSGVSTALHAQMCKILYSVKYLFLHYFTRAVFTKKKKPTPKNKTKLIPVQTKTPTLVLSVLFPA